MRQKILNLGFVGESLNAALTQIEEGDETERLATARAHMPKSAHTDIGKTNTN